MTSLANNPEMSGRGPTDVHPSGRRSLVSPEAAPVGVEARAWFVRRAATLLEPLARLMQPGRASLAIEGRPSSHGAAADRLEAFARPALLAAMWLKSGDRSTLAGRSADDIAHWLREAIRLGTDPTSDEHWGNLTNYHQHAVEMAILTMAIEETRDLLWEPLDDITRERFAAWLGQIRGHAGHANNHWFFDVLTLEFLRARGCAQPGDDAIIDWMLDELERMHRAGGWFIDGCNETYDHYNAYAFHTYGLQWARRHGHLDPQRRDRWRSMTDQFVGSYARLFAASGEPVPLGRSLTYRFNAASVFPLAAEAGVGSLAPGEARRLTRSCIDFFDIDRTATQQGCLSVGWTDEFEPVAEPYSCAGSPYWAAKAFLVLTLPEQHAFFAEPEQPTQTEREAESVVISAPGWVVRSREGEAEVIAGGPRCAPSAAQRFGAHKWGRLSMRTGHGWLVPDAHEGYPADASLTAASPNDAGRWFGRQMSTPLRVTPEHIECVYALGAADADFHVNVRTRLWWRSGWIFALHDMTCWQPTLLRHGGFAIPADPNDLVCERKDTYAVATSRGLTAALQVVDGMAPSLTLDLPDGQSRLRRHLTSATHALAIATAGADTKPVEGKHRVAVLFGSSRDADEMTPWRVKVVKDGWLLSHDVLGEWAIAADPEKETSR